MIRIACVLVGFYNVLFAFPAIMLPLVRLIGTSRNVPLWLFFLPAFLLVLVHSVRLALFKETARLAQGAVSATAFVFRAVNAALFLPAVLARSDVVSRLPIFVVVLLFGLLMDVATFWMSRSRRVASAFE